MPLIWRNYLARILMLLAASALVGALYDRVDAGLLVGAIIILAWHVRKLLQFERSLSTADFSEFRTGEGIWQHIYSQFRYQRLRAARYKSMYRQVLKEFRKSTNAMPDGGIVLNSNYEIQFCNRATQKLVGFKRKKDRGQRVDNLLRDPAFTAYLNSGDYADGVEIPSPVRDQAWLHCRIVPYGAEQLLLLVRDITERHRLTVMRRDFVANASHELRSPLTVITGYLDAMGEDPNIAEDWRNPIDEMRRQTGRMNSIVAELLELSRLESGGADREQAEVDVLAILSSARKSYAGLAGTPGIELNAESTARLYGNAEEIESVVSNLLSNAVRHTPADGTVSMTWRSNPAGGELIVQDTGSGIADEHISRLTERFFRVDSGRSRDGGGIGLGLAIVKHVLMRHDAKLHIESEVDVGSKFVCSFPAERLRLEDPEPIRAGTASGPG